MKSIAKTIAGWCLKYDGTNESEYEVVVYGLELIFGTILKYIILLGIGFLLNRGIEFSIILGLIAVFRTFAGGVHGKTSLDCFLYMLMVCVASVGLSELSKNLEGLIVPGICYLICLYVVYQYIPLQSRKNPISDIHIMKKKKIGALIIVAGSIFLFITVDDAIQWTFLYPLAIEITSVMIESKKRRDKT